MAKFLDGLGPIFLNIGYIILEGFAQIAEHELKNDINRILGDSQKKKELMSDIERNRDKRTK